MTEAELDDLEAKAKAATPGPYHEDDGHIHSTPRSKEAHAYVMRLLNDPEFKRAETNNQINRPWHGVACVDQESKNFDADVAYLLAANPATVLALIAEVRRLQDKNAWLLRWAPAEDECQTPGGCTRENCGGDCDY